ncbi:MAG TPA: GAF domain-containing sensor histidine kinase [Bryobacteraceae bacterium]|nr:GAF domain-containing sensor histidine kinase [Bryobacteraceae bacterium]
MQATEISPELAEAADVLSDRLRVQLRRLTVLLAPSVDRLERRFLRRLQKRKIESKQRAALAALTPGSAARILSAGHSPLKFIEQVEYNGRRLAKFNLPPSAIAAALKDYDRLLTITLRSLIPGEYQSFRWVREQLHFCIILTLNNAYYQVREAETEAFYELFRVELESRNLDELVRSFLDTLVGVCHADAGHLYLLNEDGKAWVRAAVAPAVDSMRPAAEVPNTRAWMRALARPCYVDESTGHSPLLDASWTQRFRSCWSIPLATKGRTAGVMQLGFSKSYEWLPRERELLAAAAERCLVAADKARLMEDLAAREEQVRRLAEHMLHVEEVERRRISRELHDEAGQSLLCIRLQMELLEQALPETEGDWRAKLREARDLTERTILEMRRLIAALSPAVLEQLGLGAALRQLVNRFRRLHPCRVRLHLSRLANLPQNTEIIVYRLVQECCNNIAKHSAATHVNIFVASADGILKLNVEDNGIGFVVEDALARRDSFGLSGMRERVALLGGRFDIHSASKGGKKDRGTRIFVELPIAKEDAAKEGRAKEHTARSVAALPLDKTRIRGSAPE